MSTERDFDEERERREWQAQESALRAERAGARASGDPDVAQYRLIARALRNPPLAPLPSDFAARVAASAERSSRGANESVEMWLERGLVALLLLAGAAALLVYNGDWLRELSFSVPERAASRRPDDRELESRDRGLRRDLLGVRARPASRSFAASARWIPSRTPSRAWRSRPPACAARRRSRPRRSSWAPTHPTSTSSRAFGPTYEPLAFRRGWTHGVLALALWPFVLTGIAACVGSFRAAAAQARRPRLRARVRCSR